MCVVMIAVRDADPARQLLEALRMPGQRTIHMARESDSRRRAILSGVAGLDASARIVTADRRGRSDREARDLCLRGVFETLPAEVTQLTIESCDQDSDDRQVARRAVHARRGQQRVQYDHSTRRGEPLLWMPDIVAWSYGRGGDWRRRVGPMIAAVDELDNN
jgi:hypothetical protein